MAYPARPIRIDAEHLDDVPVETWEKVLPALRMEQQYQHFRHFARAFWDVAEPSAPCVWAPHMDVICDEIQAILAESDRRRAVATRILKQYGKDEKGAAAAIEAELGILPRLRLVLLIPPRYSKSTLVQRLLPAWRWLHRPQDQILALSGVDTLIERDGLALRDIIKSPQFKAMQAYLVATKRLPSVNSKKEKGVDTGQSFGLRVDQFAKEKLQNTAGGSRAGHVLGGKYTGVNSDITTIDDPHDIDDGLLETTSPATKLRLMNEVRSTYKDKIQDRLNSQIWGVILLIMQRVHPLDLADYMITTGADVVCLPARYDPTHPHRYTKDWRTEPGEALNPLRFPPSVLDAQEKESPHGFATKQMMRPSVQEGVRFKRPWFAQRYDEDAHSVAAACDEVVLSVDCANKVGARNDYTSIGVWGRLRARRVLLDRRYFRAEMPGLLAIFDEVVAEWPEATLKLVEDKANGTSLIQMRKEIVDGIVPVNPRGDKESRANYAAAAYEAGNVWLPLAPWVDEYIENMVGFGAGGMHDDDVDMTSQVMERWATGHVNWLTTEMRATLADPRPGALIGEHTTRWERRPELVARLRGYESDRKQTTDPPVRVYVGLVPGWAQGRPGSEAIAVIVDERGKMLSMVETGQGGIPVFATSLELELTYWSPEPTIRYAELSGMPAAPTLRELQAKGLRIGTRPTAPGQAWKPTGHERAGYTGDRQQAPALWASFLAALSESMVGVRDAATLTRLETVVEEGGIPRMPDGSPLTGRVLAYLLAVEAANAGRAQAVRRAEEAKTLKPLADDKRGVDLWGKVGR